MSSRFTQEELASYRLTAERRKLADQERLRLRREKAWEVAGTAAALLKERFGASQVLVFGSLAVSGSFFRERSDIDLAAAGLARDEYYAAVGRLQLLSADFEIDLVDLDRCPDHLRDAVYRRGVSL